MQYVGFALVVVAVVSFVVGLLQRRAAKTILAAPFRRTGELARGGPAVADARGITSCEGRVAPYEPVLAPCSGQPCVYFELEIVREWERCVTTEDGTKVEHGSDTVQRIEGGGVFLIDDGTGAIAVDSREGMSVELDTSFEQAVPVAHGDVVFGGFRAYVPPADGEKRGRSVKVVEKIVPPGGAMFVLGQLANGRIGKPQGVFGTLRASRNGRAAMIGTAKRNAVVGLVVGGLALVPGVGLSVFGDPPEASAAADGTCAIVDESTPDHPCTGHVYGDEGRDVALEITRAGTFVFEAGPPRGKKIPILASIRIKDATGKIFATNQEERTQLDLPAGHYTVNVKDSIAGEAQRMKGGFTFELAVTRTALAPPPAPLPAASAASAPSPASSTATPSKKTKKRTKASRRP